MMSKAAGISKVLVEEVTRFVFVLFIASIMVFTLVYASPKGTVLNKKDSWMTQYSSWMQKIVLHQDMGDTIYQEKVNALVSSKAKNSFFLITLAILVSISLSLLWVWLFYRLEPYPIFHGMVKVIVYGISVTPVFLAGYLFILVSSEKFHIKLTMDMAEGIRYYLIPGLLLGVGDGFLGEMIRHIQTEIKGITSENYMLMAKAKGASFWKHIRYDLIIQTLRIISSRATMLISGTVIIEIIFNLDGIGNLAFNAAETRDVNLLLGILILSVFVVGLVNLVNRMVAIWIDPRLKANG
ncbi:MAG: ABC transporter permease [bacterium]|nr:ABC transporter permease [bacterium]